VLFAGGLKKLPPRKQQMLARTKSLRAAPGKVRPQLAHGKSTGALLTRPGGPPKQRPSRLVSSSRGSVASALDLMAASSSNTPKVIFSAAAAGRSLRVLCLAF
jgi:hypothetical protein